MPFHERGTPTIFPIDKAATPTARTRLSYQAALTRHQTRHGLARISWATWSLTLVTISIWCITAWYAALAAGAHNLPEIIMHISNNAINISRQDEPAVSNILVAYGAKENTLILQGQYWRFVTPMFLHLNALHVALNMFNLLILGIFLERLAGPVRLLLIYVITGIISTIASFIFAPQVISVGASGAIFGLVGAYSIFILMHRRALRLGGIIDLLWLAVVIGINLGFGFLVPDLNTYAHISIPNVDNYAHVGGLLSGCLLGWWFMPFFHQSSIYALIDTHSLSRRWPLALLTIVGTVLLATLACYLNGPKS